MNLRKFALILVATLIPALAASAQETKHYYHAAKVRMPATQSGANVRNEARRPSNVDQAPTDEPYFTSANGS